MNTETKSQRDLAYFLETSKRETREMIESLDDEQIYAAARLIMQGKAEGSRLHITGIGKPAHLAGYIASLFSSTGTPTYFLHGTEAVHGSSGQTVPGDVVICISNSGSTPEMQATVLALKNNACRIIGVSGSRDSWLARQSDVHVVAHADDEGGPLGRAPRMSIIKEMFVLQAISVVLQSNAGITPEQYVCWHPSGALGKL